MPIQGHEQEGKGEPSFQLDFINKNAHLHVISGRPAHQSLDFSRWHGWSHSRHLCQAMGEDSRSQYIFGLNYFASSWRFFFLSSWNKLKLHCPSKTQQGRIRKTWKEGDEWHLLAIFLPIYWRLLSLLSHLFPSRPILTLPTEHPSHLSLTFTLQHPQAPETVKVHQRPHSWPSTGMRANMCHVGTHPKDVAADCLRWTLIICMMVRGLMMLLGTHLVQTTSFCLCRMMGWFSLAPVTHKSHCTWRASKAVQGQYCLGWWNYMQKHCCWCRLLSLHVLVFTGQQERIWKSIKQQQRAGSNRKNMRS